MSIDLTWKAVLAVVVPIALLSGYSFLVLQQFDQGIGQAHAEFEFSESGEGMEVRHVEGSQPVSPETVYVEREREGFVFDRTDVVVELDDDWNDVDEAGEGRPMLNGSYVSIDDLEPGDVIRVKEDPRTIKENLLPHNGSSGTGRRSMIAIL